MVSLAQFTLMAGAASGALLALSNFQGLTISVPVQCLYAYNLPIQRCSPADFVVGGSCSQSCIAGLQAAQFTVRGLCSSANAPANSLLKQIQDGHILDVLCGPNKAPIPTTATSIAPPKETPSKPAPPQPPSPETTPGAAPRPIFSTLSTSTEAAQATSPPALPETNASSTTNEASSTSTETQASTTSEVVVSSATTSTTETPSSPAPQPSNNDQASSSTTSTTKPKPTRPPNSQPGSGGGSPFDFVPASRATKLGLPGGSLAIAIAIACTTLMLS